jgi:hypothetical protein
VAALVAGEERYAMRAGVLLVVVVAVALLLVGCESRRDYASDDNLPPNPRVLTVEAFDEIDRRDRATRAAEGADRYATDVARERAAWDRAVRDCIRAGNSETLCKLDPYNPYGQE